MIPFLDLKGQYRGIKSEIDAAIGEVLEDATFALGPAVARFEADFASYVGTRFAVGVNSGTSALHLALLASGVGPGDEVIAPAMTFVATVSAILYTGARPILVDVDPWTYTMDPGRIDGVITDRTKAIIPVHLYGQAAEMDGIKELAVRHRLLVIEDAAQAHGTKYKGRRCGCLGDIGCFSFYPGKNLGACGEGGAITTDHEDIARTVKILRDWGQDTKYHHLLRGFNYRMDGIQGAVLAVKLKHLNAWNDARRHIAAQYDEALGEITSVMRPAVANGSHHTYHVYAALVENRAKVQKALQQDGIATGIHYPIPVHLQPCFSDLGYGHSAFPVAEKIGDHELSLPIFPELDEIQVAQVVDSLRRAVAD